MSDSLQETGSVSSSQTFMIVGLGNPGRKYAGNRHNIGFMTVDRLAEQRAIRLGRAQSKAIVGDGHIAQQRVILAKPQTFMNRSGDSVGPLAGYYRVPVDHVLVIYDELDLPLGTLRLREKGGAGGHNGMKSLIQHLGNEFPRMRLGIGRPPGQLPPAAYVLQDFRSEEREIVDQLIDVAIAAIETFVSDGIDLAMTRHNTARQSDLPDEL